MKPPALGLGTLIALALAGCGTTPSGNVGAHGPLNEALGDSSVGALEAGTSSDAGEGDADAAANETCAVPDAGACYTVSCGTGVHTLQANRDRLLVDNARRRCTDACTLYAALNQAERTIFLMTTAYFGAPASRLYPPSANNLETVLDHAIALYSINGPKAGQAVTGLGGNDYNRIYLGFDAFAECVMRDFSIANPNKTPGYNAWVTSDDLAGPHAPFTQREMIFWYRGVFDLQSEGPQWHHWHQDSDFTQSGIDQRLGVCGTTDRSLTEATIAFDSLHNSDPLGDYTANGGYGSQIVSKYAGIDPDWGYAPTGCPATPPVNTDEFGGGTFAGMGPSLVGSSCSSPALKGSGGC